MIIPKEKIKVFISSRCGYGYEKYNLVRQALKTLIESTQLADVYLFEEPGASTVSAIQHYSYPLRECHVCIFLIDNADDIGEGVKIELEVAKKNNIKSLYYFCDENSKEMTYIQKGLIGPDYSKHTVVHLFKDFINVCAKDIIDDLILVYKQYCKPYNIAESEVLAFSELDNKEIINNSYLVEQIVKKDTLNNNDKTKQYFNRLLIGFDFKSKLDDNVKTNLLDDLCCRILPTFFEAKQVNRADLDAIKDIVKDEYSKEYYSIVAKRIDALSFYLSDELQKCIDLLNEALGEAKKNNLSDWVIDDILIDLRNIAFWYNDSKNQFVLDDTYQKSLDEQKSILYYPVIDRIHTNLYEKIVEETMKYRSQSPYTINMGTSLEQFSVMFANSFMLSLLNGSITHMNLIYKQIRAFTFYFSERYNNGNTKMLLLKSTVINHNKKEIEEVLRVFSDLPSIMTSTEAFELYDFTNNKPIYYQKVNAKLEAFKIIAYLLNDEDFDVVWNELYGLINDWFNQENVVISIGNHIFEALSAAYLRIPQEQIITIVIKCFEKNYSRFFDDIFKMLYSHIEINELSIKQSEQIIEFISRIIKDDNQNTNFNSFTNLIMRLRKQSEKLTREFDDLIKTHMEYFYENTYKLEILARDGDLLHFIKQNIKTIVERNETQGKNGTFVGYSNNPYHTICNIIGNNNLECGNQLINDIVNCCVDTIISKTQTIRAKMEAIDLVIYLLGEFSTNLDIECILQKLNDNADVIRTGSEMMCNVNQINLEFNISLLYAKLGQDTVSEVIEKIADMYNDPASHIMEAEAFSNYLKSSNGDIDTLLSHVILQNVVFWSKSDNLNVRYFATKLLFDLIKYSEFRKIIINQFIRLISEDVANIKALILRNANSLKDIDVAVYEYILKTGLNDSNYAVRKIATEVKQEKA